MRRLVPVVVLSAVVVGACGGSDGSAGTKAFCGVVRQLRRLGRDPGSTEAGNPQVLEQTVSALRDLERAAPSDLKGDIFTIRDTLDTIASLDAGKTVDPKKLKKLSADAGKVGRAGDHVDTFVSHHCGVERSPTSQ
jgi:hypothetical protein